MNRPAKGVICVPSAEHYCVVKEDVKHSHIYDNEVRMLTQDETFTMAALVQRLAVAHLG